MLSSIVLSVTHNNNTLLLSLTGFIEERYDAQQDCAVSNT